jgi:hypothetical protein
MSEEKKLEMTYEVLTKAKQMIEQIYKPEGKVCIRYEEFTDDKVRDYYYRINDMCSELADRGVFPWQKEED